MSLLLLALLAPSHAQEVNCTEAFVDNPPWCLDADEVEEECAFEAMSAQVADPLVYSIRVEITTANGNDDDTDGDIWVQLTNEVSDRVYLNKTIDDFENCATCLKSRSYELTGHGVVRLSDIVALRIGNDSGDMLGMSGIELSINETVVYETPVNFYQAIDDDAGAPDSYTIAASALGLDAAPAALARVPMSMNLFDFAESKLATMFASPQNTEGLQWSGQHPAGGLEIVPAPDGTSATMIAHVTNGVNGVGRIDADLTAEIFARCDGDTNRIEVLLGDPDFDITYAANWGPVEQFFIDLLTDDDGEVDWAGLLGKLWGFASSPAVGLLVLPLEPPGSDREAMLRDLRCPEANFGLDIVIFKWDHQVLLALTRVLAGEVPAELPECVLDFDFRPDLQVTSITKEPFVNVVDITVKNHGVNASAPVWLDVFFGLAIQPSMGTLSSYYVQIPALAGGASHVVSMPRQAGGWVDTLVDSMQTEDERYESNNHSEANFPCQSWEMNIPGCGF